MPRVYDAKKELEAMCFDITSMIERNDNPITIFTMIRNKIDRLENPKWYQKVVYWNDYNKHRNVFRKTKQELEESKKDILEMIETDLEEAKSINQESYYEEEA